MVQGIGATQNPWMTGQMQQMKDENDELLRRLAEDTEKSRETGILGKIHSGGTLTVAERDYLRANKPDVLDSLMAIEREGLNYQRTLQMCRNKNEQKQLSFHKTMSVLCGANLRGQGIGGAPDSNNTLIRLHALRRAETNVRSGFSLWV